MPNFWAMYMASLIVLDNVDEGIPSTCSEILVLVVLVSQGIRILPNYYSSVERYS